MPRQRRQELPRILIYLDSLRIVKSRKIVNNPIYRMGTVTHLPYFPTRLTHRDGSCSLCIEKQKALIGQAVRFDFGSANEHGAPPSLSRFYSFVTRPSSGVSHCRPFPPPSRSSPFPCPPCPFPSS